MSDERVRCAYSPDTIFLGAASLAMLSCDRLPARSLGAYSVRPVSEHTPLGGGMPRPGCHRGPAGATAIGIVAPLFGGTERLNLGPVRAGRGSDGIARSRSESARSALGDAAPARPRPAGHDARGPAVGGAADLLRVIGGGTLDQVHPLPVVTGYLSGVGVVIFLKQLPGFLGLPKDGPRRRGPRRSRALNTTSLLVGLGDRRRDGAAPYLTRKIPAAIVGLAGGAATYFAFSLMRPSCERSRATRS